MVSRLPLPAPELSGRERVTMVPWRAGAPLAYSSPPAESPSCTRGGVARLQTWTLGLWWGW